MNTLYNSNEYVAAHELNTLKTHKELFGNEPLEYISEFFLILSDYYQNTNQRTLMFETLQYACEIDKSQKNEWMNKLGAANFSPKDIESYLQSYIDFSIKIKMVFQELENSDSPSDRGMTEMALNEFYLRQAVELKNCEFIVDHFKNKLPEKDAIRIETLLDKCKLDYNYLKDGLKQSAPPVDSTTSKPSV